MKTSKYFFLVSILILPLKLKSQCPSGDFLINANACVGENLEITNQISDAVSYNWDFCEGDLSLDPTSESFGSLTGSNSPRALKLIFDGTEWFAFITSRDNNSLYRISYGEDIDNPDPLIENLENIDEQFSAPQDIKFFKESGLWYGLVYNSGTTNVVRLDFGASLGTNDITASPIIGSVGGSNTRIEIYEDVNNIVLFLTNYSGSTITKIDFGTSILSTPTISDVDDTSAITSSLLDIDIFSYCGNYYAITISYLNRTAYLLNFGTSLLNDPATTLIGDNAVFGTELLSSSTVLVDRGEFIFLLATQGGNIYRINVGDDPSTPIPVTESLGALGQSFIWAHDFIKTNSEWYGFSVSFVSRALTKITFPNICSSDFTTSVDGEPVIAYESSGDYAVGVETLDSEGNTSYFSKSVSISSDIAPSVSFESANQCIDSPNTFNPNLTDLTSYSWDFDGDGIEDSDEISPVYQYESTGTYLVRLDVNDGTCTNFIEQEITIYPAPPVPSFDLTSATLCVGSTLTLTNTTDETGVGDVITYEWDFSGEGTSTESIAIFEFLTAGSKTITLKSIVPGCEETFDVVVEIQAGPTALFEADSNCLGEVTDFTNQSSDGTSYSWDFGDGNTSVEFSPSHTYASAGDYEVTLVVTDASSCESTYQQEISIFSNPSASFLYEEVCGLSTETIFTNTTNLNGTSADIWSWKLDGVEVSTLENPSIQFSSVGSFEVELMVTSTDGCESTYQETIDFSNPNAPSGSIEDISNVCINEQLELSHSIVSGFSYEWDFCDIGLDQTPSAFVAETISELSLGRDIDIVFDNGSYFGMIASKNNSSIIRLDFGSNITNDVVVTNLGNVGELLFRPSSIELVKEGDVWLGFVLDEGIEKIIRLNFGSSLSNTPTAEILLSSFDFGENHGQLDIATEGNDHFVIISEYSDFNLAIIDFGNSFSNTPTVSEVLETPALTSANLASVDLLKVCDSWYGVGITTFGNPRGVFIFDWGSDLFSTPTISEVGASLFGAINPFEVKIIFSEDTFFGLISTLNGDFFRIDLGVDLSTPTSIVTNLGDFGIIENALNLEVIKTEDQYHGFILDHSTNNLYRLDFPNQSCDVSGFSTDESPKGISYQSSGSFPIKSKVVDEEGSVSYFTAEATITSDVSPSINFTLNASRCITNPNTFTPNLTGLSSYSWDFNIDNIEDSNEETPTYQFPAIGTYTVRLDVNDGTCTNFTEQEITIYPEPPVPSFDIVSSAFCEGEEISFSNTTSEAGYDDVLSYEWYLNDVLISNERDTVYTFLASGEREIGLKASLPGCESVVTMQTITINDVPTALFSADTVCVGEATVFSNQSIDASSYSWDFGDGNTSTLFEPSHIYADTGTYTVRLAAIDISENCSDTLVQLLRVNRTPPTASFNIQDQPYCIGSELLMTNLTDDASFNDEVSYEWSVTDLGTFTDKNISLTFETSGEKTIELKLFYRTCESAILSQTITVNDLPDVDFSSNVVCQNEVTIFTNESENAETHHWDFGDGFESTAENSTHLYSIAGSYMATLTVTDSNGCTNEIINEVIVTDIPVVNFDFELACSSSGGVQFTDMTTVENADVVAWAWTVNDEVVSNLQNPNIVFESAGIKNIRLLAQSSNGCESVYEEEVDIRSSPLPDFSFDIGCQGEISSFVDITSDVGNTITQWLWTVEGQTYSTEEVNHVFNSNGFFEVMLEVTGENFCSEAITKTIEVQQLPEVSFSVQGNCSNELITLTDNSTDFEDGIVSRNWVLDGNAIGNGVQVLVEQLEAGTHNVELEVETEDGCLVSSFTELIVNPTPVASFTPSKVYGLPGDEIVFTNTSSGGDSYQWLLNDIEVSSSVDNQEIIFSEIGTHKVSLTATNSFGCVDTTSVDILIAIPEVDLVIADFQIVDQNGIGKLFLDIQNLSNLPVEIIDVFINLEDKFGASEQVLQLIEIGETKRVTLDIGIPLTFSKPAFLCVNMSSQYQGYEDKNPLNNEKCITLDPKVQVEAPFPNPVRDEFRMKVVLPEETKAIVSLVNSVGKTEYSSIYDLKEGLNNIFLDMSSISTGIYLVNIELNGNVTTHRLLKL